MRAVEAAQGAYAGLSAAHHLLIKGGPLPVSLVQRMAGYLWFDTLYECVLPLVKGTPCQSRSSRTILSDWRRTAWPRRMGLASGDGARLPRGALDAVITLLLVPQAARHEQYNALPRQWARGRPRLFNFSRRVAAAVRLLEPRPGAVGRGAGGVHTAFLMCRRSSGPSVALVPEARRDGARARRKAK